MDLNITWFLLIAILYTGYFALDGFDLGVGVLLPFIAKEDQERRMVINTVGPHWNANEVWLITAGGATFAAFPHWYATLFSGLYLPLFLILVGLIVRGVALEFRSKDDSPLWRSLWDWAIFGGSLAPAILWGVAFANFAIGIPIDQSMNYAGGFWNLLSPYALLGGVFSLLALTAYGAAFLAIKTNGELARKAQTAVLRLWLPLAAAALLLLALTFSSSGVFYNLGGVPLALAFIALVALLAVGWLVRAKKDGLVFVMILVALVLVSAAAFTGMFPNVLISNLNPEWSLNIYNSASAPATLQLMLVVALIFVPIVLAYQAWVYWTFRTRLHGESKLEY